MRRICPVFLLFSFFYITKAIFSFFNYDKMMSAKQTNRFQFNTVNKWCFLRMFIIKFNDYANFCKNILSNF